MIDGGRPSATLRRQVLNVFAAYPLAGLMAADALGQARQGAVAPLSAPIELAGDWGACCPAPLSRSSNACGHLVLTASALSPTANRRGCG